MNLDSSSESNFADAADNDGLMAQPVLFNGDAFGSAQDYANKNFSQELDDEAERDRAAAEPGVVDDLVDEDL
jgi:hypothetical protein